MATIRRQFNTGGGASFSTLDLLPRTTRVLIHRIAWYANAPVAGTAIGAGGRVSFEFVDLADTSSRIALLDAIQGTATDPNRFNNAAAASPCGGIVPRILTAGQLRHMQLEVASSGLAANIVTTLLVDYDVQPWPSATPEDGSIVG